MESRIPLRKSMVAGIFMLLPVRRFLTWSSVMLVALVGAELALRGLGLHTPLLYETTSYGYRVRPDQDLRRFGNRIFINSQGLRSESISRLPADGVMRVLCIGDSITHGGAITDQSDTYPHLLQEQLYAGKRKVEVLNASAPGWAIANEAGWLRTNGTFGAHVVLLTIGTSDLFQDAARSAIVDRHPSYPSMAPSMALEELWLRYAVPRLLRQSFADPGAERVQSSTTKAIAATGAAVRQMLVIAEYVKRHGAIPILLFVEQPERFEPRDTVTAKAKTALFDVLRAKEIAFTSTRDDVQRSGGETLFRDGLHPNTQGNRVLANVAARMVEGIDLPVK